ncbi:DUF692 domain-containing protein [Salipiger sp. 1_MG-2023]|uniref:MNIO family bufferin maturase n=1 Tax=Salipiger sp. 1_MG-2023 TaxID=3062665 RepID=UPI0026E2E141|nr:DUF692 domain-containing protein [Salipiger sp. 1_MG-2023]MDO6586762.1 DUF692 domain-containing protein [Salipiger sp. 1_MG-2023]
MPLPPSAGIGFKPQHAAALDNPGAVNWLEIHAENYMVEGGPRLALLAEMAQRFAISAHGVGLSIGGEDPLDGAHLARLRHLLDWLKPAQFSEHLAWSSHGGAYFNDLLPLPYTAATLDRICAHVDTVQQAIGQRMLLENPTSYLRFDDSTLSETAFLAAIVQRTGCGLLLDIENVFLSAQNLGFEARGYLSAFPLDAVGEIHLAGHSPGEDVLIDSHSAPVGDPVWALYTDVIARSGPLPTLIEWDADLPEFAILQAEAARAAHILQGVPA